MIKLDLVPSDYNLFLSLQNLLNYKNFTHDDDRKSYWGQFYADKDQKKNSSIKEESRRYQKDGRRSLNKKVHL